MFNTTTAFFKKKKLKLAKMKEINYLMLQS